MFSQVRRNLDRAQGGLGIGLTLVRRLTEMHGGTVTADSQGTGRGSTFTVRIPLAGQAPAADVAVPDTAIPNPAPDRLRVLIVDDNVDGAQTLALLVRMRGHETTLAHDGLEALAAIARFRPQLALVDIGLPGLNGYEIARRVRGQERDEGGPPMTLVALTGWGSDDDKARAAEAGFDRHLTKPVDPHEVEALLGALPYRR